MTFLFGKIVLLVVTLTLNNNKTDLVKRVAILICFAFLTTISLNAQNRVQWLSWEEALEKYEQQPKKIFVDVYTNWCGWCKQMDKATFQKDHIAKYINENYYAIKFNAEQKEDILFNEKSYKFVKQGRRGYHELAAALLRGKLSYPTVVFLDEDLKVIQPIKGFQNPQNFELIMTYFAEDFYKNTPWKSYTKNYQSNLAVPVGGN